MLRCVPTVKRDTERARQILARIRQIPEGFVRTYGDVSPGAPRMAGAVLAACADPDLPWHRIVRADGSLSKGRRQRRLLDREGVPFRGDRVQMAVARLPEDAVEVTAEDLLGTEERLPAPPNERLTAAQGRSR
jgi:alkylated DNA nucleotide flippase Atl1